MRIEPHATDNAGDFGAAHLHDPQPRRIAVVKMRRGELLSVSHLYGAEPCRIEYVTMRCADEVWLGAGLHAGEVELAGTEVRDMAVHIGARVSSMAGPGETLVSSTVKNLVVGSGIEFEDRGAHPLKGVPDEWRIFAVDD